MLATCKYTLKLHVWKLVQKLALKRYDNVDWNRTAESACAGKLVKEVFYLMVGFWVFFTCMVIEEMESYAKVK